MNRIKYLFLATLLFVLSSCDKDDEPSFVQTLEFGTKLLSADAVGGLLSVEVRADMPYEIVMPQDADWLKLMKDIQKTQSEAASATLSFEVEKNMEELSRNTTVIIRAIGNADTLHISQSGLSDKTDITAEFNPAFVAILQQKGYIDNVHHITCADVKDITEVNVMGAELTSLRGIEYFSALTALFCDDNQLTSLDMEYNASLKYLFCSENLLTSLNISRNVALETLECQYNHLANLDLSQNTWLWGLDCENNPGKDSIFEVTLWVGSKLKAYTESWQYDGQTVTMKYISKNAMTTL